MDANTIINILTPIFATLVTAGFKQIIPKLPKWLLPILCTLAGTLGNVIAHTIEGQPHSVALAIGLGLAGIGLREVKDQLTPSIVPQAQETVKAAEANRDEHLHHS